MRFPGSENLLSPTSGVEVIGPYWEHRGLGLRIPAPPQLVNEYTSDQDLGSAVRAADLGMASIRRSYSSRKFKGRAPLRPMLAAPLKDGICPALAQVALTSLPAIGIPSVLLGAGAVGARLSHQPVLALLAEVGFYLLVSLALHECGHILAYRQLGGVHASAVLVRTATRLRLVRSALPPFRDALVTLAGPLTPTAVFAGVLPWAHHAPLHVAGVGAIALAHLFLLILPFGDGAALRAVVHRDKQ